MLTKIQTSSKSNGNRGSSNALASYLEKEEIDRENKAFDNGELPEARSGFFTHNEDRLLKSEVISAIDSNKKGLGKSDSKFFMISFSPSEREQKHLLEQITEREIKSLDELSRKELATYENSLKEYTRNSMNEYANNFKRNELRSGDQLLYAGKIHHKRNYKGTDDKVKNGSAKSGQEKPGLQSHIHVIVSRKDRDMKMKLSPLANERGKNNNSKLNGKRVQRGFDRNLYRVKNEKLFDKKYNYNRPLEEKVEVMIEKDRQLHENFKKSDLELLRDFDERNEYEPKDKELSSLNRVKLELDNEISMELDREPEL